MNLSRFERESEPFASGSFGFSYRAFDKIEKRVVCLEVVSPDKYTEYQEYIQMEVELLEKLKHPNIVELYGGFFEKDYFYIVLEYVEGGDFKKILKANRAPLSEETVLLFFCQLVSALSYVHSLRIIHRDLKPENILLTKDSTIKITNFSSARILSTCLHTLTKIENPIYFSPEVISEDMHSFHADIWSLGCVIYELMTGETPFYHPNECQLKEMILSQKPSHIEGNYSARLKETVMKMLEKNLKDRI